LARHLLRADTNEFVQVHSLDGVTARELRGALFEMSAMGAGSRSQRPLYHASINTPVWEALTDEQAAIAIDRLEKRLGLADQPRAVVEHVKEERQHMHVVWLRIDAESGRAIPDSHNYRKHEEVARELEREFGHNRVQGAHHERDGVERPGRTPAPEQMQQAARTGISPREAKATLSALWHSADNGRAFAATLDAAGWTLARGDKRDVLVALDPAGGTHAINKAVTGLTATHVRQRLADLDRDALPNVDTARAEQQRQPEPPQAKSGQFPSPQDALRAWSEQLKSLAQGDAKGPQSEADRGQEAKTPSPGGDRSLKAAQQSSLDATNRSRKAQATRLQEPSRLRQALDRAREHLDALGQRLEQAFGRIRERILDQDKSRKKEANAAAGADDARKARHRQERAQQLARELLRRWEDQKKERGPSR
jgi:hypothetical protein